MTTKTYDGQTARFIASVATCMPPLSGEVMQGWIDNPQALKKYLSGLNPLETVPTKPTPFFSVIATAILVGLGEKLTKDCFPKSRYVYCDNNFDNWLPAKQPKTDGCVIATLAFTKRWTFAEAAAKVLGLGAGTSTKMLGKALIENGHTMTLTQAELMAAKTYGGERTEMRIDSYANFFFVETGDEDNPVSVGRVHVYGGDWCALIVSSLDSGDDHCGADDRLLVRNLKDASKL